MILSGNYVANLETLAHPTLCLVFVLKFVIIMYYTKTNDIEVIELYIERTNRIIHI